VILDRAEERIVMVIEGLCSGKACKNIIEWVGENVQMLDFGRGWVG